ncbi:histidine phosphatase family protein [Paucilactobacillus kaifaensis]|uniref:histidine phosphatase family protein n=1 Tax=Paucilactobacillus kaifaensis TaxID=2559921 RepID=UPI0010F4DCE6|nr:histidine phosphatase family protein [Paucilactobacillus kaifaensis]
MKQLELYFVRHGETLFNTMDKLQGWADSPLTENGIKIAQQTGQRLANTTFQSVYTSDMKRTIDTANYIIAANKTFTGIAHPSANFREAFFGGFEGLDNQSVWHSIAAPYGANNQTEMLENVTPGTVRDRMHAADPLHLAETGDQFWSRVTTGFAELLDKEADHNRVLIVAHGTLIRSLAIRFADHNIDPVHTFPQNGSVTKILLSPQQVEVTDYNLTK